MLDRTKKMTHIGSLKFQNFSKSLYELNNILATKARSIPFVISQTNSRAVVQLDSETLVSAGDFSIYLYIMVGKAPYILMLDHFPLEGEFKKYLKKRKLDELPNDIALATISAVFDPLLNILEREMKAEINILKYATEFNDDIEKSLKIPFSFTLEKEIKVKAVLLLNDKKSSQLIRVLKRMPSRTNTLLDTIKTPIYLEKGFCNITRKLISTFEVGDTLIMELSAKFNKKSLAVRLTTGQKYTALVSNDNLHCNLQKELKMEQAEKEHTVDLNQVPLTITFDIGKKSLSINELQELAPGYTLELEESINELVTLRVDNMAIGKGEIVEIGDRLGVRITKLNESSGS